MKTYATIVADPPWEVNRLESPGAKGFGTHTDTLGSIPLEYPTLTIEQIAALDVPAGKDAHLYIWTINAYVEQTYSIARAWGFEPSTLLTWIKAPMGIGLGGTFCNTTEYILFCRKGTLKAKKRVDRTWWGWPRGAHSAKPEHFQNIVESVSPGPYLEMFARRQRHGWDTWGNQVPCDVQIA